MAANSSILQSDSLLSTLRLLFPSEGAGDEYCQQRVEEFFNSFLKDGGDCAVAVSELMQRFDGNFSAHVDAWPAARRLVDSASAGIGGHGK